MTNESATTQEMADINQGKRLPANVTEPASVADQSSELNRLHAELDAANKRLTELTAHAESMAETLRLFYPTPNKLVIYEQWKWEQK